MKISAILLIIGAALWSYALTLSPYKNEQLFMERYISMSAGQSEEYWKLRDEMLTPKFQLEDYGVTLAAIAVVMFFVTRKGQVRLQSPNSRNTLIMLAITLPFLSVGGYVFDLFQAYNRGEFPHWADSMGIPLMGVPIQFIILLVWSLAHLSFLRGTSQPSTPLVYAVSLKSNWWLLFISALTAILVLTSAAAGQYWYAIPGVLWLYLYLSLGAVHRAAKDNRGQGNYRRQTELIRLSDRP
ncbi:hypothetical protein [Ferriphaselus sp. R-1]|uniref:hypothetical protein n=1 Tax=Ferriphaselus sp. R-1 TaxID=1485544 RepID=UPI000551523E|nr:hypothetical protein [Ferriphaselus sp. R-1]